MEDIVVSQKKVDAFLVVALLRLHEALFEKSKKRIDRIKKWWHRFFVVYMTLALVFSLWNRRLSQELCILLFSSLSLLQVFGWWLGRQIYVLSAVPSAEECGMIAFDICQSIEDISVENVTYIPSLVRLLTAVVEDDRRAAFEYAETLDAYGNQAEYLTHLVRTVL